MYDKEHLVENVLLITRINQALKKKWDNSDWY